VDMNLGQTIGVGGDRGPNLWHLALLPAP
jgi:hypothetical protein